MKTYDSVWDAIEATPSAAESMKARARVMINLQRVVRAWDLSQAAAARRLEVSQPRLNDLLRGKIERFSLDGLVDLAARAGLKVSVGIKRAA